MERFLELGEVFRADDDAARCERVRELDVDLGVSDLTEEQATKLQEAAAVYRKVWQSGKEGRYPGQHYEIAANSLGDLLRSKKDYAGAASAYELLNTVSQPDPEVKQKASLAAGEMYDVLKERDLAVKKYQEVLAVNSGNGPAETARKFMKEAYRE